MFNKKESEFVSESRVQVTLHGYMRNADEAQNGFHLKPIDGDGTDVIWLGLQRVEEYKITVEEVKPPILTFKPGDRIRHKELGYEVTVGDAGYLLHGNGAAEWWTLGMRHEDGCQTTFTSEVYEKVYPHEELTQE